MVATATPKISVRDVGYSYGAKQVLADVTLDVPDRAVSVFFGPAGGAKTTLMRLINRLNDLVEGTRRTGTILLDGEDIYGPGTDVSRLRRRVAQAGAR